MSREPSLIIIIRILQLRINWYRLPLRPPSSLLLVVVEVTRWILLTWRLIIPILAYRYSRIKFRMFFIHKKTVVQIKRLIEMDILMVMTMTVKRKIIIIIRECRLR